jgi:hypothetical protein
VRERERDYCVVLEECSSAEMENGKTVRMNQAAGNGSSVLGGK